MTELSIVVGGVHDVDSLRDLWRCLLERHGERGAAHGPSLGLEESWRRRRSFYLRELERPGALLLLARRGPRLVGYAMVGVTGPSHTWAGDDPMAVLESLAVLEDERGRGTGRALLRRVREELRAAGFTRVLLEVLSGNDEAQALYESEGFVARFVQMSAEL